MLHPVTARPEPTRMSCAPFAPSRRLRLGACCPSACGRCGGSRCAESPGGRASCCAADVAHSNRSCALFPPPCVLERARPSACGEWMRTARKVASVRTNLVGAHFFWINGVGTSAARRGASAHETLCAQRRPFLPWDLTQKSAAAYVVSRDGMQKLLNESGWPDVRRLSAFLTRAITQCCGLAIRRRQRSCETHPPPCTPYRFGPKLLS